MVREIYLKLSLEDRERFDKTYTSVFFAHAATQPAINAEKMLALMKCGLVEVFELGRNYQFVRNDTKDGWEFIYQNSNGEIKRDAYRYVVNARGQAKSIQTDPSPVSFNMKKPNPFNQKIDKAADPTSNRRRNYTVIKLEACG
jgi:hypothetical protein